MRSRREHRRYHHAFTLIELLAVISIIALLISILLPSLKEARGQAKKVKCMANMKSINTALYTYITEYDTYPVIFRTQPLGWATWSFGGWTGKDRETYCNPNGSMVHCYQTYERALSVYMMAPHEIQPDEGPDRRFGTADDHVTEMKAFECPSDTVSTQWRWGFPNGVSGDILDMSAYEQCGSSYQMNYYWFYQALSRVNQNCSGCSTLERWEGAFDVGMKALWRRSQSHGGSSRFVTLVEDPFDWGIAQGLSAAANANAGPDYEPPGRGLQTMGFHGKWMRHVVAFLDGSINYIKADTRYQRESHWTVTNESWYDTRRRENTPE